MAGLEPATLRRKPSPSPPANFLLLGEHCFGSFVLNRRTRLRTMLLLQEVPPSSTVSPETQPWFPPTCNVGRTPVRPGTALQEEPLIQFDLFARRMLYRGRACNRSVPAGAMLSRAFQFGLFVIMNSTPVGAKNPSSTLSSPESVTPLLVAPAPSVLFQLAFR